MVAVLTMATSTLQVAYTSPAAPITPVVSTRVMAMATTNITGDIEAMALSRKPVVQAVLVAIEICQAAAV